MNNQTLISLFCFITLSLAPKLEFKYIEIGLLIVTPPVEKAEQKTAEFELI